MSSVSLSSASTALPHLLLAPTPRTVQPPVNNGNENLGVRVGSARISVVFVKRRDDKTQKTLRYRRYLSPNSPQHVHACVTLHSIPLPHSSSARARLSSEVHLLVPLRYDVPIECLKVDSIPRRLTKRLISTHYNTTPRRWRAPQPYTCNRDRRTTICKRLSAIFLPETLRLRTTCLARRASEAPSIQFEPP
jgi:hypothetical protein